MNFSSDTIELFLAVLDRGSFSGAARALGSSAFGGEHGHRQPGGGAGFALSSEPTAKLRPTALARALAPQARMIAEQLAQLQVHALELSQGLESRLSLGVVADIDSGRLFGALRTLSERYPLLDVEVLSAAQDDALALLHGGRISLCFGFAGHQREPAGALPVCRRGIAGRDHLAAPSRPAEAGAGAVPGRAGERAAASWWPVATCRWPTPVR